MAHVQSYNHLITRAILSHYLATLAFIVQQSHINARPIARFNAFASQNGRFRSCDRCATSFSYAIISATVYDPNPNFSIARLFGRFWSCANCERALTRPFVGGWGSEWVGSCVRGFVPLYLVDTIATTVFAQSLSNFSCNLWMIRGVTLLILGYGVKGQGQLRHSVYKTLWAKYRLQIFPITFKREVVDDERRNPIDLGSRGQRSMSTLALCV